MIMTSPFEYEDAKMILISFLFWLVLYILVCYTEIPFKNKFVPMTLENELDIQGRIVSAIHGTVLIFFTGY